MYRFRRIHTHHSCYQGSNVVSDRHTLDKTDAVLAGCVHEVRDAEFDCCLNDVEVELGQLDEEGDLVLAIPSVLEYCFDGGNVLDGEVDGLQGKRLWCRCFGDQAGEKGRTAGGGVGVKDPGEVPAAEEEGGFGVRGEEAGRISVGCR